MIPDESSGSSEISVSIKDHENEPVENYVQLTFTELGKDETTLTFTKVDQNILDTFELEICFEYGDYSKL